ARELTTTVSTPVVGTAVAFDTTPPLTAMKPVKPKGGVPANIGEGGDAFVEQRPHKRDGALQEVVPTAAMPAPQRTFEGPSNEDNFRIFGFRVNPPDPVGDVGPRHYVAMTNLTFAVYSKQGHVRFGPADTGTLWQGFPVEDCTDPSGDPIVLYDEIADRWILTQFTTRGLADANQPFFNCVAVSQTGDPTGAYFRYAFTTGQNFPDYPKYGVMPNGLFITAREFRGGQETIGIYAINRQQLVAGDPNTQIVGFQLNKPEYLVGDGLLPADLDGPLHPPAGSPEYVVGSMDDDAGDHASFDALNMFHLNVDWSNPAAATFSFVKHVPIAQFDTIYPCAPTARDCLPQPGITNPAQFLDILSYRQRPLWRLQYRNFGTHESLVTNQAVEARPGIAGVRWWELRNPRDAVLHQEGTWAPNDGVHRWMGSVALDRQGNMAVGYSVVNATNVFPGIRYAGRLAGDPLGQLSQGEAVMQNGSGVQTTTNSRWGDYTSMNVDPKDGCTFWYINEYYARSGTPADPRPWQTRIGSFRFPGCL
ncbi:MAG: hypothetical protein ACRDNH_02210, partial [Gaiellaceae bacterium]